MKERSRVSVASGFAAWVSAHGFSFFGDLGHGNPISRAACGKGKKRNNEDYQESLAGKLQTSLRIQK